MRRQALMFEETATESLSLSVELFSRPSPVARDHAVIMMLAHSFEMLLKASIFQRRGTVRDTGDELSHSLARCIAISADSADVSTISTEERTLLLAIKQDRDCATHDVIMMSDDLLWVHLRSGVTLFQRLLRDEFSRELTDVLPARSLPTSAHPPDSLRTLVEQELSRITELLAPSRRRSAEAAARLRPLLSLDGSVTGREDQPTGAEVSRAARALREGGDWRAIMPGLATLEIARAAPDSDAQEVVLRIGKDPDGIPVRRARPEEADEALAYRGVSPFEEYGIKLSEFGAKLGLNRYQGQALIHDLGLKNDERAYFVKRNASGNVVYQGLSARALELAQAALAQEDFDIAAVVSRYNRRQRQE